MSRLFLALGLGALALAAGCTTVPPEQRAAACAQTDWYDYGVNDGVLGVPVSDRVDMFEDCTELGQPADVASYEAGRTEGLKEYCTVENGYEVGYSGRRYEEVCPPELEADFLQGLAQGRDERPYHALYPSIGIGIGSGHVHSGVGIGIGVGGWGYSPYWDDCYYRDPFPCGWRGHGRYGYPWWW
jgi:hypothetical protein